MKSKPIKLIYQCPHCREIAVITAYPIIPAKTYGPPEHCHPEEGGEIDPEECPSCGAILAMDKIEEFMSGLEKSQREEDDSERSNDL